MAENLNYYWQKRNEQENKARDYDQLQKDIENGLRHNATKEKIKSLEAEVEYYKNLLSKPMREIAEVNQDFEATYDMQQAIIGEWMVSQRAFRELSIKLGLQQGMTIKDVIYEGISNESKVLNNLTEYGNNFNTDEWELYYAPKIKAKMNIK